MENKLEFFQEQMKGSVVEFDHWYSGIAELHSKMMKEFNDNIDAFLIERLKELGHEFINRADLTMFVKDKMECVINMHDKHEKHIYLKDGNNRIHILTYSDKVDVDYSKTGSIKMTVNNES